MAEPHGLPNGKRVHGRINLLVETPRDWMFIDRKSNPGGVDRHEQLIERMVRNS